MKCIIYIQLKDLQDWNQYMWNLRTKDASLSPAFKTSLTSEDNNNEWIQMLIAMDDLQRIYDMMDEYAVMVEKFDQGNWCDPNNETKN